MREGLRGRREKAGGDTILAFKAKKQASFLSGMYAEEVVEGGDFYRGLTTDLGIPRLLSLSTDLFASFLEPLKDLTGFFLSPKLAQFNTLFSHTCPFFLLCLFRAFCLFPSFQWQCLIGIPVSVSACVSPRALRAQLKACESRGRVQRGGGGRGGGVDTKCARLHWYGIDKMIVVITYFCK